MPALLASATLHALAILLFLFGPALFADKPKRFEYVDVVIMPAANLGSGPVARAAPRTVAAPKAPEPAPTPVEPEPKKEVPEDIPVLKPKKPEPPKPEPKAETKAPPSPQPATQDEPPAEPAPEKVRPQANARPDGASAVDPSYRPASIGSSESSAVAGFTDPDFHFSYYLDRMVQLISQYWQPPPLRRQIQMTVGFRIASDGTVEDIRILESSGLQSFDDAGLRALTTASPLPPLPRGYQKPSLGVNLIIRNLGDS
jgi:TonB family protein